MGKWYVILTPTDALITGAHFFAFSNEQDAELFADGLRGAYVTDDESELDSVLISRNEAETERN